jgi:cytochrome c-type biogenesis protein CcmF
MSEISAGDVLIILGTLTSAGAAVARGMSLRSNYKRLEALSRSLSLATFITVSATLILLAYLFLSSDMSYYYVWWNTSTDLGTLYKLSAVWAGAQGSFLLWIWLMTLVLAVEVTLESRRSYLSKRFHAIFQLSISSIVVLFMLILIGMNLFERTPAFYLQLSMDGAGMKLVLQTPEMVIHPPVVFAGYAFCVAALAAAVAYFLSGERNWVRVSLPWTRLAWIFLTLGIGVGAIWAYYVLGWGGYWGWDPVETASLLPWIVATAFLHTQIRHARKGEYSIMSPSLGMLSFVAVVFATFATRAGGLWAYSVHSFGISQGATAAERLGDLLQHDSTVLGIFSLMLLLFAAAVYLAFDKYRSAPKPEEEPEPRKISEYVSDRNNMLLTIVLFVVTSAVILFLLFKNLNSTPQANYDEFNQKMSLFFVATMVTLSICLLWKFIGKSIALYLGVGTIVVSIALAAYGAATGGLNWLVALSLPSYLVAVGASVFKLAKSVGGKSLRSILQKTGPQIVHIGVALVLMSYVVSSNMQTFPSDVTQVEGVSGTIVNVGGSVSVGDFSVRLLSLNSSTSAATSYQTDTATIEILKSGDVQKTGVGLANVYGSSGNGEVDVYIYKTAFEDLYFDFQIINGTAALVQVKTVPFMNTLWIGFALLVVGLSMRTASWKHEAPEGQPKAPIQEQRKPPQ